MEKAIDFLLSENRVSWSSSAGEKMDGEGDWIGIVNVTERDGSSTTIATTVRASSAVEAWNFTRDKLGVYVIDDVSWISEDRMEDGRGVAILGKEGTVVAVGRSLDRVLDLVVDFVSKVSAGGEDLTGLKVDKWR